jgi:dephospho-CoA kinase
MLRDRLYRVIDADVVARGVVERGKKCLIDLALAFGAEILERDGSLNRRKMGEIVFGSKEKRLRFNEIIFPYIQEEIENEIAASAAKGYRVVFLDAPTLFESGSEKFCDKIVSVIAPKEVRRERLLARDQNRTPEEIDKRIAAQHDDEFYTSRSNFVIVNGGDMNALRFQLLEMLELCCRGMDGGSA